MGMIRIGRQFAHMRPVLPRDKIARHWFMWGLAAGNEQNSLESEGFCHGSGANKMPVMDWIETSAQAQRFHIGSARNRDIADVSQNIQLMTAKMGFEDEDPAKSCKTGMKEEDCRQDLMM